MNRKCLPCQNKGFRLNSPANCRGDGIGRRRGLKLFEKFEHVKAETLT